MNSPAEIVRACYAAYEAKDRQAIENLLADDFTFSSPLDDHISREQYFERCWPNSEHLSRFHIKKLFVQGDEVFVQYECQPTEGPKFRNTEFFTLKDGKISHVDVYFGSEDGTRATEAEIRALVEETVKACNAKDPQALIAHYAPDVLAFDLINPLQYTGSAEVGKRVTEWFDSFNGPMEYKVENLHVAATGETAFCHSLNQVKGAKHDGQKIEMWWRATLCLQKLDGKWLITHAHDSVPFEMETGKASLALTP